MQDSSSSNTATSTSPRRRFTRRLLLRGLLVGACATVGGATYARGIEPQWVDFNPLDIALPNLPAALRGTRVAHLTDLHASTATPLDFLRGVIERVNDLAPDFTVVTGDLVTHSRGWVRPVVDVLAGLKSPVYVSLGNHDYGLENAHPHVSTELADEMTSLLTERNMVVLRNAWTRYQRGGAGITIVGLEDYYTGRFSGTRAFAGVDPDSAIIALSHNPDSASHLQRHGPGLICSGHTHGGQVRLPLVGALVLPVQDHRLQKGHFRFGNSQLYISRGVGCLKWRIRFNCRPEVPIYTLLPG